MKKDKGSSAKGNSTLRIAFACDEEGQFTKSHFGDAQSYELFDSDGEQMTFIKRLSNKSIDEDEHGSNEKAKSVRGILAEENVAVLVSRRFGPNIKKIRGFFAAVVSPEHTVANTVDLLLSKWGEVTKLQETDPKERLHLYLDQSENDPPSQSVKASAIINAMACRGCRRCVLPCPVEAIDFVSGKAIVNENLCVACGVCLRTCPPGAIKLVDA